MVLFKKVFEKCKHLLPNASFYDILKSVLIIYFYYIKNYKILQEKKARNFNHFFMRLQLFFTFEGYSIIVKQKNAFCTIIFVTKGGHNDVGK